MTAPPTRLVDQFTGQVANAVFFQALSEADEYVREVAAARELQVRVQELEGDLAAERERTQALREAFTAAVGEYSCPCGGVYEFDEDSSLEDYAALNRWLGLHMSDEHNARGVK